MDKKRKEHTMRVLQAEHGTFTNKNIICFVEIHLALFKRLPNSVQKGCNSLRVMLLFLNLFIEFKDIAIVFVN